MLTTLKTGVSQNPIKLLTSRQLLSLPLCSGRKLCGEHTQQMLGCQALGSGPAQQGWRGLGRAAGAGGVSSACARSAGCWCWHLAQSSSRAVPRLTGRVAHPSLCAGTPWGPQPWPRAGPAAASARGREAGKHTSLLHLPLNKKSSKCLINSLGRNKNIMRKTIWLEKKMALAGSLLLAVAVHMCLAEVVIRALANGLFTCFYIAPLYVLVILNLAAKRSSSEICVKP